MADPHLQPELDGFDTFTVTLYRTGMLVAALGLAWTGMAMQSGTSVSFTWWATTAGAVLCAGNLHLYDKRVRWAIAWMAWGGVLLRAGADLVDPAALPTLAALSNGLVCASLSGVILKEWFCFRIPGVRAAPLALAAAIVWRWLGGTTGPAVLLLLGALGLTAVAFAKWRMPLSHDIGDRDAYQV